MFFPQNIHADSPKWLISMVRKDWELENVSLAYIL